MPQQLGELPENNAKTFRDETFVVYQNQRISFVEHHDRAALVASALFASGLKRQDRIAVLSRNSPAYLEIFSAAQTTGLIVATVNFRLATPEAAAVLSDAAPAVLFFEAEHAGAIESLRATLPSIKLFVCMDGECPWATSYGAFIKSAEGKPREPCETFPEDIMHLIYTSGTTGRPKGVMRSHAAEMEVANLMTTEIGVLRGDVVQIMMPLFHVGARWLQLGAQARGARIVLHREVDALEILQAMDREKVTITHMAPTIVQQMLDHPEIDSFSLKTLRGIYYSAAPMPFPLLQRGMKKLGSVFVQAYGMTEGFATTLRRQQHQPDGNEEQVKRLRSVGQASTGVRLRIVDDTGNDLPQGSPGEILTFTTTRMSGYWNNSIATSDALKDGWYRTGDVGYLDHEGFLYLVDRKKDMIISGGENIYCREVEDAVVQHPAVMEVAVIGLPDPNWGESVCAIVVKKAGLPLTETEVIDHCRPLLASYKKPKSVRFIDTLPRLNTGKVDKVRLRALMRERAGKTDNTKPLTLPALDWSKHLTTLPKFDGG